MRRFWELTTVFLLGAGGALAIALQLEYRGWSLAKEREHVKRREDSSLWDLELFETDKVGMKEDAGTPNRFPFTFGVFPNPKYNLIGVRSFRGLATARTEFPWNDRFVEGNVFSQTRSPVNEKYIGTLKDEVFFHLLVLTDQPNEKASQIISRNHPHIIGQGQFKTSKVDIDYIAFQTAERQAYAIVNMRLFDLRAGRLIVVAPQKDGTMRSMQLNAPMMGYRDVEAYHAKMLKDARVTKFLNDAGNL